MEIEFIDERLIDRPEDPLRSTVEDDGIRGLAESIQRVGLIQPITVRRQGYRYEVVVGDRRLAACRVARLERIPCVVREDGHVGVQVVRAHENLQRRDMAFRDEARMVRALYESEGEDVDRAAAALNRGRAYVEDRLLFDLMPPQMQEAVDSGALAVGSCRELMAITVPEDRHFYLGHAIQSGASRNLVRSWRQAWEVSRVAQDPTALGRDQYQDGAVPRPSVLPCIFCGEQIEVQEIVHLRTCKGCAETILLHRPEAGVG